ncbi:MAG: diaminopimelate decarboxylase [Gammaproteobacteria bacterium]|nr:diaminopimelate decarboxylase [Gammaproteobacteria bacterium]
MNSPAPDAALQPFISRNGVLHAEGVSLERIAEAVGTPVYVYSRAHFENRYEALHKAMAPLDVVICYAVKANSNLSVLRCFAELGAGFDIVSGGELQRVISIGVEPARLVFSGVGKSGAEIDLALKLGIGCFNVESASELDRIEARAELLSKVAPISVRINPDVDANTHPYISTGLKENKFGVPKEQAIDLYRRAAASDVLSVRGIDCHIGSQLNSVAPLVEACANLIEIIDELEKLDIQIGHIDMGGGLGVSYRDEAELDLDEYGRHLASLIGERDIKLFLEPGRLLVANGGVLLTRVEYLKPKISSEYKSFAVVDAAMNDLLRPALYQAWHDVVPVNTQTGATTELCWDIVGPVCETGDFLAHDRHIALSEGDLLAVLSAGAYGMVQSSNYNTRGRPAEVLVDGSNFRVVRRRETTMDQLRLELNEG